MVGLPDGEKTLRIYVTVYTQYRRVTDGRTDGRTDRQTSCQGIVRAMHTRRAVKWESVQHLGPVSLGYCVPAGPNVEPLMRMTETKQ